MSTRLHRIHPYPAMISDALAERLAEQYVKNSMSVLDPFCGSGRAIIAASQKGATSVGLDINPLACLIAKSKVSLPNTCAIDEHLKHFSNNKQKKHFHSNRDLQANRKVEWFPQKTIQHLNEIIDFINTGTFSSDDIIYLSTLLSATVREVSFCRNNQWKLHRIPLKARKTHGVNAWDVFLRRYNSSRLEASEKQCLPNKYQIIEGDTKRLSSVLRSNKILYKFDCVITSPPYGDSQTTVQYGAISSLCIDVLRFISKLNLNSTSGTKIDNSCLGGVSNELSSIHPNLPAFSPKYWHGGSKNQSKHRVITFFNHLVTCLCEIDTVLNNGGYCIFVTGNRKVGGWRQYMDRIIEDSMHALNYKTLKKESRKIKSKLTPVKINRKARSNSDTKQTSIITTMREENIIIFKKHN